LATTVVVCAYTRRRWELLAGALRAAVAQRPAPVEVLLVVDHNPDLAAHARSELHDLPVTVLDNRHRRGLSGARNTAVDVAVGDVLAFLDDDALPVGDWLAALLAPFAEPEVVATGGVARPVWAQGRPAWFPREFDWVVGCSYLGQPEGIADVRNPLGCNMAFRRSALARVGAFRDDVGRVGRRPLGCEETELCIRLRQQRPGARIVMVPDAVVDHHVTPDRHRLGYFLQRCWAEGLSKAVVTENVGAADGLSSERAYVTRTLPEGILSGLRDGARTRRADGPRRAGAIAAGLGATVAGYGRGRLARSAADAARGGGPA
jgi:GT2 family glycosyltransferase